MNVGELHRERDRLLGVIEEAKTARIKLKQVNVLLAMYGDGENVDKKFFPESELCRVDGCTNRQEVRGVCSTHYSVERRVAKGTGSARDVTRAAEIRKVMAPTKRPATTNNAKEAVA